MNDVEWARAGGEYLRRIYWSRPAAWWTRPLATESRGSRRGQRLYIVFFIIFLLGGSHSAIAQPSEDDPKYELFIGFSQNRIKVQTLNDKGFPVAERVGFNGFDTQVTVNLKKYFGLKGDVSGHFRRDTQPFGSLTTRSGIDLYNALVGPQVRARNRSRFTPYAHALFGAAHSRSRISLSGFPESQRSTTRFAMAVGGGLDVSLNRHFGLRVVQVDYNPIFFSGAREDAVRYSFGVVIK